MILGTGVDILDIRRIRHLFDKFGNNFINKYYTSSEKEFCFSRKNAVESFAKIFSIKESVIKAISDKDGMSWHKLEVSHDILGKPIVFVECKKFGLIPNDEISISISASDEFPYVITMAIIEQL